MVSQSWIGLRVTGLSGVAVPPPCLDHPLDNTPPFFFFFQPTCNPVILRVKNPIAQPA